VTGSQLSTIAGPAIVTGGGQGLGRSFCQALADRGVTVVVADLNLDNAQAVASEIKERGGEAHAFQVDVADVDSVARMVTTARNRLGPPTVLVNNAALFSTLKMRASFTDLPVDEWRRVLDVNVTGVFLCCRAVAPMMATAGYGKIVNMSSSTVWTGRPGYLHYVTSKAALIGLTRSLASELGPAGIRVNAITPGSTQTEVARETMTPDDRETMTRMTPLRRVQVANDVVGTLLFLVSRDSDFITGQTINVDGGLTFH
jgi:3-oxoacyl-[acyl-carrier protein] reductase